MEAALHQFLCQYLGILLYLLSPLLELRLQCLTEGNSLGSDDMLQRTALLSGEDGRVQQLRHLLHDTLRSGVTPGIVEVLTHQDNTATWTTQGLMGGRGNDVCILHGIVEQTSSNQTSGMCHINHQQGAYLVGNLTHTLVVPLTTVSTTTTDNQLGFVLQGQLLHLVVIHTTRLLVQIITNRVIQDTGGVDVGTMREVTAVVEVHTHEGVAGLQNSQKNGCISLCS